MPEYPKYEKMTSQLFFLLLLLLIIYMVGIFLRPVLLNNEMMNFEISRLIISSGDPAYLTQLDGEYKYPNSLLIVGINFLCSKLLGFNEMAFRMPSLLITLTAAALLCQLCAKFENKNYLLLTPIIYLSSYSVYWAGSAALNANLSGILTFLILGCYYLAGQGQSRLCQKWFLIALFVLLNGLLLFAGGLSMFLYLICAITIYELIHRRYRKLFMVIMALIAFWMVLYLVMSLILPKPFLVELQKGLFNNLEMTYNAFASVRPLLSLLLGGAAFFPWLLLLPVVVVGFIWIDHVKPDPTASSSGDSEQNSKKSRVTRIINEDASDFAYNAYEKYFDSELLTFAFCNMLLSLLFSYVLDWQYSFIHAMMPWMSIVFAFGLLNYFNTPGRKLFNAVVLIIGAFVFAGGLFVEICHILSLSSLLSNPFGIYASSHRYLVLAFVLMVLAVVLLASGYKFPVATKLLFFVGGFGILNAVAPFLAPDNQKLQLDTGRIISQLTSRLRPGSLVYGADELYFALGWQLGRNDVELFHTDPGENRAELDALLARIARGREYIFVFLKSTASATALPEPDFKLERGGMVLYEYYPDEKNIKAHLKK